MLLHFTSASPFVRKVRIAADVLGLNDRIELREADLNADADPVRRDNPLGKIPALVLDDGTTLYDSRVILEYLDHLAGGGRLIPEEPSARFAALRLQALCDGILDAGVLQVYESRYRPDNMRVQEWTDRQAAKVERALSVLEADVPAITAPPDVGQIALACALGYLDLRFGGAWRKNYPKLVEWLDLFATHVPAFAATKA